MDKYTRTVTFQWGETHTQAGALCDYVPAGRPANNIFLSISTTCPYNCTHWQAECSSKGCLRKPAEESGGRSPSKKNGERKLAKERNTRKQRPPWYLNWDRASNQGQKEKLTGNWKRKTGVRTQRTRKNKYHDGAIFRWLDWTPRLAECISERQPNRVGKSGREQTRKERYRPSWVTAKEKHLRCVHKRVWVADISNVGRSEHWS